MYMTDYNITAKIGPAENGDYSVTAKLLATTQVEINDYFIIEYQVNDRKIPNILNITIGNESVGGNVAVKISTDIKVGSAGTWLNIIAEPGAATVVVANTAVSIAHNVRHLVLGDGSSLPNRQMYIRHKIKIEGAVIPEDKYLYFGYMNKCATNTFNQFN